MASDKPKPPAADSEDPFLEQTNRELAGWADPVARFARAVKQCGCLVMIDGAPIALGATGAG